MTKYGTAAPRSLSLPQHRIVLLPLGKVRFLNESTQFGRGYQALSARKTSGLVEPLRSRHGVCDVVQYDESPVIEHSEEGRNTRMAVISMLDIALWLVDESSPCRQPSGSGRCLCLCLVLV